MLFDEMKKIVSILYLKEPIAYTKNDYNVKNVYLHMLHLTLNLLHFVPFLH